MGKYSKVIKQVEFGWRLAKNGWADTYCKSCGYTENHDVHVNVDYKFCPGCGGSVAGDRFKYDVKSATKRGMIYCSNCHKVIGWYDKGSVKSIKFCPYCGDKFDN